MSAARGSMKQYWDLMGVSNDVKTMMLDSDAPTLDALERPQILGMLPDMKNKRILELAAGIGRFTPELAKPAKSVLAVDFIEKFIMKNKEVNGHLENVTFACEDVTSMELEPQSIDIVFSCWLLMYLSNNEVDRFARNCLKWLPVGGHVFFRESCFSKSGNAKRIGENPTVYRKPEEYNSMFMEAAQLMPPSPAFPGGSVRRFQLVNVQCVPAYTEVKGNQGQLCWLWQKVEEGLAGLSQSTKRFLDANQYSLTSIQRYEEVYGDGFVSAGGRSVTAQCVERLGLQRGQRVLEVGCGLGGGAFYMAQHYGAVVTGVDLSANMINTALERVVRMGTQMNNLMFEMCDITTRAEYPAASFDCVYSHDAMLHIQNKPELLAKFFRWLKPGGMVVISDYCCGPDEPWSASMTAYVKKYGYHLLTTDRYAEALSGAGFELVAVEDNTEQFIRTLQAEMADVTARKNHFVEKFSETVYTEILDNWQEKLGRCEGGEQRWGVFHARKPLPQEEQPEEGGGAGGRLCNRWWDKPAPFGTVLPLNLSYPIP